MSACEKRFLLNIVVLLFSKCMCAMEKLFTASDVWNIPPHNAVLDNSVQYSGKFRTEGPFAGQN